MDLLLTALAASIGMLVGSALLPSRKLRRTVKDTVVLALAIIVASGAYGLAKGDGADGLLVGLAMGFAWVVPPHLVLALRARTAAPEPSH